MAEETDGVGETFDDSLRIALTVASQFGERISRLREQLARQREADARQEARELQARFDAERGAARAQLAVVNQPEWWTRASVENIASAHETATAWRDHDDTAAAAHDTIRREVRERYGVDVDRPGADPTAVAEALRGAERDRAQAREERRRSGEDLTASQLLLAAAEGRDRDVDADRARAWEADDPDAAIQADRDAAEEAREARQARDDSALAYDSAERRDTFARSLEGTASEQEIHGRVLADTGNAKHPREAVTTPTGRSPKPRKLRTGLTQQRDRGGLSR
jgi:colicin import membrane protein